MRLINKIPFALTSAYREKDFSFLVFCLSLFFLPLSVNLSSFGIILSICLKLIQVFFFKQKLFSASSLKYSSIIGFVFFTYIIFGSLLQSGFEYTVEYFGKQFSRWELLFLTPILFRSVKENQILLYFFFSGLIISIAYVFTMASIYDMTFNNESFLSVIDIHHTYLCIFLLFFVNFLFIKYSQWKHERPVHTIICGIMIILSFFMIFILESKVSIVIFCILVFYHLVGSFSKRNAFIYIALFSAIGLSFFFFNKRIKVSYEHALDFRLEIWNESINLIEQNPLFGSLKRSEKDLLNYRHYISGKYYFMDSDLNSHNQYLSILIKYGAIGAFILSLYAILFFNTVNKSTSKKSLKEFFGFFLILILTFYIENVLDRHHGIVFCTVFYNYFLINVQNEDI